MVVIVEEVVTPKPGVVVVKVEVLTPKPWAMVVIVEVVTLKPILSIKFPPKTKMPKHRQCFNALNAA